MPEVNDPAVVAANNAEVIAKQAAQDIAGKPTTPDIGDGISALDALRAEAIKQKKDAGDDPPLDTPPVLPKGSDAPPASSTPPPDPEPETPEKKAEREEAEAAARAAKEAEAKAVDEIFKDSPKLPPNASLKSGEAFSAVKAKAASEIRAREEQLAALKTENAKLKEAAAKPMTAELEQELKSLRDFRAKLDVEADPAFKEFDGKAKEAHEFIYAQLLRSPSITDETIAQIKKLGGPEFVKMAPILDSVEDPVVRRLVEAKLADLELVKYNKDQAIKAAKENIGAYVEERNKRAAEGGKMHTQLTKKTLDELVKKISWLQPKPVDATADNKTRELAESHNKYAVQVNAELQQALEDDSPEMRATLLAGMAQLFRLQTVHEVVAKDYDKVKAELVKSQDTIKRLTGASQSRLAASSAPANSRPAAASPEAIFNESAADALNRMRKEKMAAAARE